MKSKCYIISYDFRKERDYTALHKAIKSYGTWAHILESTWAVVTDQSAKQIRDYLKNFLGEDDKIFVIRSGIESAWINAISSNNWLKGNLIR